MVNEIVMGVPALGIVGLIVALIIYGVIKRTPAGEGAVTEIAQEIHLGAMVFMRREYTQLSLFAGAILIAIFFSPLGLNTAIAFLVGAVTSAAAGYIGMFTATKANVRTTVAANEGNVGGALSVAFFGGSVMGLTVASLGLLGVGTLYLVFGGDPHTAHVIHGFGMGASTATK